MAASALTPITVVTTGAAVALAAANADGNYFANNTGRTVLLVKNAGAGSVNVTVNSQRACDQGFDHDLVVAVANDSVIVAIGPFTTSRFNDGDGRVQITYSGVSSVTVAVLDQ